MVVFGIILFTMVTWALDGTTLVGITGDHILITIASVGAAVVSAEAGAMAADSTVVAFIQETITIEQDQETRLTAGVTVIIMEIQILADQDDLV